MSETAQPYTKWPGAAIPRLRLFERLVGDAGGFAAGKQPTTSRHHARAKPEAGRHLGTD